MTEEKLRISSAFKLKNEQRREEIEGTLLPKLTEDLESAREQGDLSENFDYHATKDEITKLKDELRKISEILAQAVVVPINYYKYKNLSTGEVFEVTVVDPIESDLFTDDKVIPISKFSGIGRQIDGAKVGDIIEIIWKNKPVYKVEILDTKVID